jgi:hypothetical protein
MTFLYTATERFDKIHDGKGMEWDKYIEWSKLTHLAELVSPGGALNEILVEPDYENADDWNFIHIVEQQETGFFTSLDFVFKKIKGKDKFNLLTVVIEPDQDCRDVNIDGFEFMGYDLLDQEFSISALTNCGGFDETFLSTDLNEYGLIEDYLKAYDIKKRLLENNPEEHHADTNVIAIWRHKTMGR